MRVHSDLYELVNSLKKVEEERTSFPVTNSRVTKMMTENYKRWATFFHKKDRL